MRRVRASAAVLLLLSCLSPLPACAQGNGDTSRLLPLPSPPRGLHFDLNWDSDLYDNVHGGRKRGYATDSVLTAAFSLDTGDLGWWQGGRFKVAAQAIASTHPSEYAGDLQTLSNLDAPNQRHLTKFWYAQDFGAALVRGGIMDLNQYFDLNDAAGLFPNSSFGIIPTISADVPAAIYPDFGWGLMTKLGGEKDNWRLGIFQGDPTRRSSALHAGAMAIAEHDWRTSQNHTHFGIGAWYRQVPESGTPPTHDWGAYANLEHALPAHPNAVAFLQVGASPGQVNTIPAYLGAGVHFYDVSQAVSDIGVGFARAWIRNHAAETSLEATALLPLFGGSVALQPDVQYILHPSGTYPNALVVGLRLHVTLY